MAAPQPAGVTKGGWTELTKKYPDVEEAKEQLAVARRECGIKGAQLLEAKHVHDFLGTSRTFLGTRTQVDPLVLSGRPAFANAFACGRRGKKEEATKNPGKGRPCMGAGGSASRVQLKL